MVSVRGRNLIISAAAGLLTPLPLLALFYSGAGTDSAFGLIALLVAGFIFAFGLTLLPLVNPILYGTVFAPSLAAWFWILEGREGRSGNLFGLGFIVLLFSGVIIGVTAGMCGWLAKRWWRRQSTRPRKLEI